MVDLTLLVLFQVASGTPTAQPAAKAPVMIAGPDDYDGEALRQRTEASVPVELDLDKNGVIVACRALGNFDDRLKQASCQRMRSRARFQPARDAVGRPIASRWNGTVRWGSHPNLRRHPLETARGIEGAMDITATFTVEKDGLISSCKGLLLLGNERQDFPAACADAPKKVEPMLSESGEPVRRHITVRLSLKNEKIDD